MFWDLALGLLVTGVRADHEKLSVALDDLALLADRLHRGTDLHELLLTGRRSTRVGQGSARDARGGPGANVDASRVTKPAAPPRRAERRSGCAGPRPSPPPCARSGPRGCRPGW